MKEFKHPTQDASYSLPERLTVRYMLRFDAVLEASFAKASQLSIYERLWPVVVATAQDWKCDALELDEAMLDADLPREAVDVLKWACLTTFEHLNAAREVPKN